MPELAEKLSADEHGKLGEQDRSLYVAGSEENTFVLHPAIVSERTALKTKNAQILDEKKRAAERAKVLDDLGLDGDALKSIVDAHKKAEESKLSEQEKQQRKEASMKDAHTRELQTAKDAAAAREKFLLDQLREQMITSVAKLAIEQAGVIEGGVEALLPHVVSAMDMTEEGDDDAKKFVTRVIDGTRQPRYSGSDFMTPQQLVEEFKKKPGFMGLFKATGKGGSGATPNQQNRNTTQRSASEMTSAEKIAAGLNKR